MIFWTIATWVLTYPLVLKLGYIGVAIASAIVAVSSIITVYFVKKEIPVSVGKSIFGPLLTAAIMFIVVRTIIDTTTVGIFGLILTVTIGAIIYFIVSFAIFRKHLTEDFSMIIKSLFNR